MVIDMLTLKIISVCIILIEVLRKTWLHAFFKKQRFYFELCVCVCVCVYVCVCVCVMQGVSKAKNLLSLERVAGDHQKATESEIRTHIANTLKI